MVTDEMVEKAARRMAVADGQNPDKLSHNSFEWWRHYVPMARAALEAALSAAEPVKTAPSVAVKALQMADETFRDLGWHDKYEATTAALAALSAQVQDVAQNGLTLSALQSAHVERQEEWCPDVKPDLSFRGNELGGECGEAQNVIKKLERERHGWRGSRDTVEHLAEELADVIHCSVLVAITAGVDLQQAVIAKFNDTSMKNGLSVMLPAAPAKQEGGHD